MEKVKLTKEVANAIETVWGDLSNKGNFTKHLILTNWSYLEQNYNKQYKILGNYARENMVAYAKALTEGYEIELTPEEKIKELYEEALQIQLKAHNYRPATVSFSQGVTTGVLKTLSALGIEIEGITDEVKLQLI